MQLKIYLTYLLLIFSLVAECQNDSSSVQYYQINNELQYGYHKPKLFDLVTNIPKNYLDLGRGLKDKNNLAWVGITIAATGMLIPPDQDLIGHVENISYSLNLSRKHKYGKIWGLMEYPTNISATFYHFGHGSVSLLAAGGFLVTGLIKKDYRAIHTSIEIGESILTLGVMTQGLKRVFGRQSPSQSTVDGGEWDFFPNQKDYMKHTAYYDAMPSGHMATIISTVTVISKNYPEVKWIKPLGYTMATLMAVEMMNSGVHWASDYPLGILIGYSVATISVNRRITKVNTSNTSYHQTKIQPQFFVSSLHGTPIYGVKAVF
ncbi:MAG: phosphatase PAP2 family protein [Flavobacteriales bacterium]